jgi:hypothetical protein
MERRNQNKLGYLCSFKKLPKVNNRVVGENSPNMVTPCICKLHMYVGCFTM